VKCFLRVVINGMKRLQTRFTYHGGTESSQTTSRFSTGRFAADPSVELLTSGIFLEERKDENANAS